jgi:hypothetical protein
MQDNQAQGEGHGYLRKSQAQTETGLIRIKRQMMGNSNYVCQRKEGVSPWRG